MSATGLTPVCPQQGKSGHIAAVETRGDNALDSDSERAPNLQRVLVPKPSGETPTTLQGRPAFMQGKISGATSPKGLIAGVRAVFRGVAPAPPAVRSRGPTRPGHWNNCLLCNQLTRSRMLRSGLPSRPGIRAFGHFPRTSGSQLVR